MVRIDLMADRIFRLDRRELLAGLGAAALGPAVPDIAAAQSRLSLKLQARAGSIALRPGQAGDPDMVAAGLAARPRFAVPAGRRA